MRPASVSGSAVTLLITGTWASCHSSPSNAAASSSTTSVISGEWNAPETGRRRIRFGAGGAHRLLGRLERVAVARR